MTAAERFAQARPRLLRLAYSELGDLGEAEDVVQEAWLRLERADADAIENLDGWLTTVVGRLALDHLRSARARRETYVGPWLPEPLVSEDPADRVTLDESVSYALLTVLEQLSPAERTAFVLHDVFDVPFGDVAEVVGRSPEAVRQLASRARRHVKRERPRVAASRDEHERTVRAFAQAVTEGDLEGLVAVLDPDVVWTSDGGGRVIASRKPIYGGARVARAWAALEPQGHARTDRDRAQWSPRTAAPEPRRPSRRALLRRQRRSHHTDRCGPQPGEAAAPMNETFSWNATRPPKQMTPPLEPRPAPRAARWITAPRRRDEAAAPSGRVMVDMATLTRPGRFRAHPSRTDESKPPPWYRLPVMVTCADA